MSFFDFLSNKNGHRISTNIPKNISYFWEKGEISARYRNNIRFTKIINPNHKVKIFNDEECLELLYNIFPKYVDTYISISIPSCKSDIMRMILLYQFGGWYLDCDTKPRCSIDFFEEKGKDLYLFWVKSNKGKLTILGTPIGGASKHPFFLHAAEIFFELLRSRLNNHSVYPNTGPAAILAAAGAYINLGATKYKEADYSYVDVEGDETKGSWTYQEACGILIDDDNPCKFHSSRNVDQIGSLEAFVYFTKMFDRFPQTMANNYRKLLLKAGNHYVMEHKLNNEIVDLSLKYVNPEEHPKYYSELTETLSKLNDFKNTERISQSNRHHS